MSLIVKIFSLIFLLGFLYGCAIFEPDVMPISKGNVSSQTKQSKKQVKGVKAEGYTIQVGAFKKSSNADKVVSILNNRGLDAFLYKDKLGIFKVRFGSYSSYDIAKNEAIKLMNSNIISDYYIVKPEEFTAYHAKTNNKDDNFIRSSIVDVAYGYRGVPYTWGGDNEEEGFDCSGLTRAVYRLNGLDIPRVSRDQFEAGNIVSVKSAKMGDLVFFSVKGRKVDHVGIFIGDNKFIHAPSKGKTVTVGTLNKYWSGKIKGFRSYL